MLKLCLHGQQISLSSALTEGCALNQHSRFLKVNIPTHTYSYLTARYTVAVAIWQMRHASSCLCKKKKILWTFLLISHVILGPGSTFLHLTWTLGKPPSCRTRTVTFYMAPTARQGKHMMGPSNKNTHL